MKNEKKDKAIPNTEVIAHPNLGRITFGFAITVCVCNQIDLRQPERRFLLRRIQ